MQKTVTRKTTPAKLSRKQVYKTPKTVDELVRLTKGCSFPCTKVIKMYTDYEVPGNTGRSSTTYTRVDGFKYLNIHVRWPMETPDDPTFSLGILFAFDKKGTMRSRRYVNLEENITAPQAPNMISVTGENTFGGSNSGGGFVARVPIMGPYVQCIPYNVGSVGSSVTVWAYLVA